MRIPMVTMKRHTYGRKKLNPGDRFVADNEGHARVLETLSRARRDIPQTQRVTSTIVEQKPKRQYRRRDMTAES